MFAIGIDLGTTNSAVAILKGRPVVVEDFTGSRTLPSAVGWDPDMKKLVVGIDAKESLDLYNTVLSVKRVMGTDDRLQVGPNRWRPEEVSAEILKVLKRQVEEKTGEEVTDAVITVPAYFQMAQKAATEEAGKLAGLNVQQLLEEPSAAVMAYGPQEDEKILVYDLGGGTFDVCVIDYFAGMLTTKAVFGNNHLGGDDFDRRIVDHLVKLLKQEQGVTIDLENDLHASSVLRKHAEKAKIEMSRKQAARINIATVTEANGRPIGLETVLKTADFNAMIRDLVESTMVELEKALKHAKLDKSDIDTILLVGGSTYVPLVQQMVRDYFGKEPSKKVNPDLAVALGAAASLVIDKPPEGGRHVVTVGFIPETTPQEEIELEGRTSPDSQVRIAGGAETVNTEADPEGYYSATVRLTQGMNTLTITATSPDGQKATLEAEPVIHDPNAQEMEAPPAPPAPRLARAVSFSCTLGLGTRDIQDYAKVILQPQTELPCSFSASDLGTSVDNQREIMGEILEGHLPMASLNTRLAAIRLHLPPNVPAGEQVIVHFSVDESSLLTAELEVPAVNRKSEVTVKIKPTNEQVSIFEQVTNLFTQLGDRIRPEEKAAIEQSRIALEDLSAEFVRVQEGVQDADGMWDAHQRLQTEAKRLTDKLNSARRKYA